MMQIIIVREKDEQNKTIRVQQTVSGAKLGIQLKLKNKIKVKQV